MGKPPAQPPMRGFGSPGRADDASLPSVAHSDLIAAARSGDDVSAVALWSRYGAVVRGAIRKRLSPSLRRRYDTDDIAQSVFADLLRDLARFEDRGENAFKHWLYLKAENKVRDKLRRVLGRGRR